MDNLIVSVLLGIVCLPGAYAFAKLLSYLIGPTPGNLDIAEFLSGLEKKKLTGDYFPESSPRSTGRKERKN